MSNPGCFGYLQGFGNILGEDPLGQALHDGCLAHTRISDLKASWHIGGRGNWWLDDLRLAAAFNVYSMLPKKCWKNRALQGVSTKKQQLSFNCLKTRNPNKYKWIKPSYQLLDTSTVSFHLCYPQACTQPKKNKENLLHFHHVKHRHPPRCQDGIILRSSGQDLGVDERCWDVRTLVGEILGFND